MFLAPFLLTACASAPRALWGSYSAPGRRSPPGPLRYVGRHRRPGEPQTWTDQRGVSITTTIELNTSTGGRIVTQSGDCTSPGACNGLVGATPQKQRFTYDRLDRLVKAETLDASDAVITTVERSYNHLGRLVDETQTLESWSGGVSYGYTLSGALESVTYPRGDVLTYDNLDALDRPLSVTFDGRKVADLTYAGRRLVRVQLYTTVAHPEPVEPTDELTLTLDVGHDNYGRTTDYLWSGAAGEPIDCFQSVRDENGNPKFERADVLPDLLPRPFAKQWSFALDGVDRLVLAKSGNSMDENGVITTPRLTMNWTLDDLGARTGMTDDTGTHAGTFNTTNEMTMDVVGPRTATFVYDAAGNCLSSRQTNGVGYFFRYDVFNRLVQVQDLGTAVVNAQGAITNGGQLGSVLATYVYDALGRRVHAVMSGVGSGSRWFLYDGWRVLEERNSATSDEPITRRYLWGTQALDELWALDNYLDAQSYQRYLATRDVRHNVRTLVWYDPTAAGGSAMMSGAGSESGAGIPPEGGAGEDPPQWAPDYGGYDAPPEPLPVPYPEDPPPEEDWPPAGEGGDIVNTGGPQMNAAQGGSQSPTQVLERYLYKPYGERVAVQPSDYSRVSGDDDPSTAVLSPLCPYGFQGLRHNEATFLIYMRERYYDPVLNRFTQGDPTGYTDGMNLYEAFASNPAGMIDPMGTDTSLTSGWNNGDEVIWKHYGWFIADEELAIGKYYYTDGEKFVVRELSDSNELYVLPFAIVEELGRAHRWMSTRWTGSSGAGGNLTARRVS